MKVLLLGFGEVENLPFGWTSSTLATSNPFGYDAIVVDPANVGALSGGGQTNSIWAKWNEWLNKWLNPGHKIIVLMRPYASAHNTHNNYDWIPLTGFNPRNFQSCGTSDFIGTVITKDAYIKQHFHNEDIEHVVCVHYKFAENTPSLSVNSKIDNELITSFTWREELKEIIFVPPTQLMNLRGLINSFDNASNKWKLPRANELDTAIHNCNTEIITIEEHRTQLLSELQKLNTAVHELIDSDIYLSQAVRAHELVQGVENPDPENFYAVVEAVENAFNSEREMREKLGFSKTQIGKLKRRTNEFRHVAKSGQDPTPLNAEEVKDFTELVEGIISKYINYLYENEQS